MKQMKHKSVGGSAVGFNAIIYPQKGKASGKSRGKQQRKWEKV